MGLFDFLRRGRGMQSGSTSSARDQILMAAAATLDSAITRASPYLLEQVKVWTLDNPSLLLTLGYIAGFTDAAYQSTRPNKYDERHTESMYIEAIERNLGAIDGTAAYIKLSRSLSKFGGSDIGGLQSFPQFMKGMMAGGGDFVDFVNQKRPPLSLARLLGD